MRSSLKVEIVQIPQGPEEREQREAQNRGVIALDPLEEVDADPFDLIGPDAVGHAIACQGYIALDGQRPQGSHHEMGALNDIA